MIPVRATIIQQPEPYERLIESIDWAARLGYRVEVGGDLGIRHATIRGEERWIRERSDGYVSPLGAVVLREQPRARMMPEAAADAMQVAVPFVVGCAAGYDRRAPEAAWLAGFSRATYMAGYEVGVRVRALILSAHCAKHGTQYSRVGGSCPRCDVDASTAWDDLPSRGGES